MVAVPITEYVRPNAEKRFRFMEVDPDLAAKIVKWDLKLSIEYIGSDYAGYIDWGKHINDDPHEDPDEFIFMAPAPELYEMMTRNITKIIEELEDGRRQQT